MHLSFLFLKVIIRSFYLLSKRGLISIYIKILRKCKLIFRIVYRLLIFGTVYRLLIFGTVYRLLIFGIVYRFLIFGIVYRFLIFGIVYWLLKFLFTILNEVKVFFITDFVFEETLN